MKKKAEFPDAANVICNDSYMNDILSGESTLEGAKKLQTRLSQLLQRGGFELHKWVSNSPELLKDLSASSYVFDKEFQDAPVKTLGMLWDPKVDCLTYKVRVSDKVNFSKRDVLSKIARLYDPLGLIGPIVTKAKIFIQELWKIKLDWSEQLPPEAMEEWVNFYQKLAKVNNFKIPRCILLPATIRIEIHGFSDASERAYAAVVYIKCFNEAGQSQTRLLCNKSRVAPLKTLTIPRLELSAALLLSRLVKKVVPILQLSIHKIWMWTDSTIALAWIKTEPHKLKTFVSNRVAEIQALSKDYHWKHVSSKNNPADLISRGCNVDELLKNEMWFSGPDLQTDEYEDNQLFPDPSYRDELKCAVTLSMTECSSNFYDELFNVTNNFIKLIRIFSFIFRFINNIKAKESCNKEKYLTADEVKRSTEFLAKIAQLSEFKAEIDALKKALKRLCARRGRISTLMSDNATNFKGAAAELNRFIKLICNKNETLANYFASEAIQWKFIPPRSPNFGGLWEAGVKSFKHHLYRTLVNSKITFEEFETIIIQIEGILNSRPLVPLSDNINEYEVLTPGHFIIGRPISAIPEPAILDISDNRLSRWQYTTKCVQTIWKRWKNDYLNHLQQRNKWQFEKNNVAVGCLVL
ncbi:integrase catalytic domain-containing protein [Trichonephila clavipes]|nr:integrase catalytic domain-containing protein [Trichonephila clavipes]